MSPFAPVVIRRCRTRRLAPALRSFLFVVALRLHVLRVRRNAVAARFTLTYALPAIVSRLAVGDL